MIISNLHRQFFFTFERVDLKNKDGILLQDSHSSDDDGEAYSWYFIVNTCDALKGITGKTDCYTEVESKEVLN